MKPLNANILGRFLCIETLEYINLRIDNELKFNLQRFCISISRTLMHDLLKKRDSGSFRVHY
jgi:hypothetical protein